MSLPTDGFTTRSVGYTAGTDNGLVVTVSVDTETSGQRTAAEELLPYLESALTSFRTAYEGGTTHTINYIQSLYSGDLQDSL